METIGKALAREHNRLLALLDAALRDASTGDRTEALAALTAFLRRLRTHVAISDELLFPAGEHATQDAGCAAVGALRREHDVLRRLVGECEAALLETDGADGAMGGTIGNLQELRAALQTHLLKEERVLHPMVDRQVTPATIIEMAALLRS